MKKYLFLPAVMIIAGAIPTAAMAQTHCRNDEVTLYSGRVGSVSSDGSIVGSKYVSICSDRANRMGYIDYRFGRIGNVEMEVSAPSQGLAFYEHYYEDKTGWGVLSFKKGTTTYAFSICTGGMCSDMVRLMVFSGRKRVAALYADNENDINIFQSDLDLSELPRAIVRNQPSGLNFSL